MNDFLSESDDQLLRQAVKGDNDALFKLLRRVAPQIRASVKGQIPAKHIRFFDEDDIMSVTYLEAFHDLRRSRIAGMGRFVAWLKRIATNNLKDALKGLEAGKRIPPDKMLNPAPKSGDTYVTLFGQIMDDGTTPSFPAGLSEIRRIVDRALAQLPDDYARVIQLYDLEEKAAESVATAMDRSIGAIYMLRQRALDHLKRILPTESNI